MLSADYRALRKELHATFAQPLLYLVGTVFLLLAGYYFYTDLGYFVTFGFGENIFANFFQLLFVDLRERYPSVNLHALSAPELDHLSKLDKRPVSDVIRDLKAAGLGSVPGASSNSGMRFRNSSMATRISRRARCSPRQRCGPTPKAVCTTSERVMSKRAGSPHTSGSRDAAA